MAFLCRKSSPSSLLLSISFQSSPRPSRPIRRSSTRPAQNILAPAIRSIHRPSSPPSRYPPSFSNARIISPAHQSQPYSQSHPEKASQISPKWLKDLEIKQSSSDSHAIPSDHQPLELDAHQAQQIENGDQNEIIIYQAFMKDDFTGSPNRIGLSIIGLLITSGLVANQINHHGAGPVWKDSKSDWLDFELKLWDQSTRKLISIGIITFSLLRSLKFLFTLSHTIKRITIKSSHLHRIKKVIATKNQSSSSMRSNKKLLESIEFKFYSIGSLDVVYPINKLFKFSIFDSMNFNNLIRFPITQSAINNRPYHSSFIWLKYFLSEQTHHQPSKPAELKNQQSAASSDRLIRSSPRELNSLTLQIPRLGIWGNSKFDLDGFNVQSVFESMVKPVNVLISDDHKNIKLKSKQKFEEALFYKTFGIDLRQSIKFNLIVLRSILRYYYLRLFDSFPSQHQNTLTKKKVFKNSSG